MDLRSVEDQGHGQVQPCYDKNLFSSQVMTSNGILMNNALANFVIPTESQDDTDNQVNLIMAPNLAFISIISCQIDAQKRPLSPGSVALAYDSRNACGQRLLVGGATASTVGEVIGKR